MGTPQTLAETLTNSGGSSLTITQANLSGAGFTMTGLTLPVALAAGQSTTFNVTFTPSIRRRGQRKSGHRQQRFQLQRSAFR